MEEKKEKKKINKKALLVLFILAIAFAIIGFIDIKSNAAELTTYSVEYIRTLYHFEDSSGNALRPNSPLKEKIESLSSNSPIDVYYYCGADTMSNLDIPLFTYYVSKSNFKNANIYANGTFVKDGITYYWLCGSTTSALFSTYPGYVEHEFIGAKNVYKLTSIDYMVDASGRDLFVNHLSNGTLQCEQLINYDNLQIDDDMPVPINLKRNVIRNDEVDKLIANALATDIYDYITWTNTDDKFRIQLQTVPVVQYYKLNLNRNKLVKEYYGEWKTQEIYTDVSNSYLLCTLSTDLERLYSNSAYADGSKFKSECNEKYQKDFLEENYLYFGYRIRYVDVENNKASNWVVLVPSDEFDSYKTYIEYSDGLSGDSSSGNGLYNEYENLEDVEDAKKDVETENVFKDKYQVVDGDADTQEVMNWLNTVVSFIKGTPDLVTEVLSFLPQPILYGMYITIFLGVIASAIAIIKALI